jgi:hypothetical protein
MILEVRKRKFRRRPIQIQERNEEDRIETDLRHYQQHVNRLHKHRRDSTVGVYLNGVERSCYAA